MSTTKSPSNKASPRTNTHYKSLYHLTWRWHFYAGLFVVPFMLMLSITGAIMLFDDEIEQLRYGSVLSVEPASQKTAVSTQLHAVKAHYPDAVVTQFIPSQEADIANRFSIKLLDQQKQIFVTVNPYTAEVLGSIDRSDSIYNLANGIHSTLLIGDFGDLLIEISASLGILLLVTGIYLWLPRDSASKAGFFKIRFKAGSRIIMRDLHANLAGILSVVLLFFLVSGLSWTGVWGAKLVQAWNTFPTYYVWGKKPESLTQKPIIQQPMTHAGLNHGNEEELPWNLELAELPESTIQAKDIAKDIAEHHKDEAHDHSKMQQESFDELPFPSIDIDRIIQSAESLGFEGYRIFFPRSKTGVYTISANSMAGDVSDPRDDLTVHIDQYSGELLMQVSWQDYSAFAKVLAASVSLHQGDVGLFNKVLNAFFCFAFLLISLLGIVMWWKRRPANIKSLGAPPKFQRDGIWKTGLAALVMTCVLFPMAGAAIVSILLLDWVVLSRWNSAT